MTQGVFSCKRCGNCCRHPGYVRLSGEEVDSIAAYLGIAVADFTANYTRLLPDRSMLSLVERDDQSCVFLSAEGLCEINEVKPRQCVEFPAVWRLPEMLATCRGYKESR